MYDIEQYKKNNEVFANCNHYFHTGANDRLAKEKKKKTKIFSAKYHFGELVLKYLKIKYVTYSRFTSWILEYLLYFT